jgi:ATP phosphoribosyltransferase
MASVRFAIPKGSLEKTTFEILEKAWYKVYGDERTYRPVISDTDIGLKLLRPQEIPVLVADGLQDVGITGTDWIHETQADVMTLLDLQYGMVRLVLAVPKSIPVQSASELFEKTLGEGGSIRIATEYLNISSGYVMNNPVYHRIFGKKEPLVITPWWRRGSNRRVSIYLSFGATEAKPPEDADAIIDVIETGRSLDQNNLKAIDTVLKSSAVLIANKNAFADPNKREKILDVLTLLKGVIDGEKKLHIFVNVRKVNLRKLIKTLPALKKPTISPLSENGWYSVNTVIEKVEFLKILPTLRRLAQGLVVHHPKQILSLEEITAEDLRLGPESNTNLGKRLQ